MDKQKLTRSLLSLVLLLAVLAVAVLGVNVLTAPLVEAHKQAALGDNVVLYDRADPDSSSLTVSAKTVQSVYRNDKDQVYTLHLSTNEGYTKDTPIELTLVVDFEGKIVSLSVDSSGETRELSEDFLPGFVGQDSTLAGVQLVASVTFSSSAIKNAVNDGFQTLIDNGLFAAAEKSAEQLLKELLPTVYPELVSGSGAIQGEAEEISGHITEGYRSSSGDGFAWFLNDGSADYLGVWTAAGGAKLYNTAGETVADEALLQEIASWSEARQKALLGDAVLLYDRNDPAAASIQVSAETVDSIYQDDTQQVYTLHLSTNQGYVKETPIVLTLVVDYEGKVVSLSLDRSGETRELSEDFLPGFVGEDSTLAGVQLVAGVTFSSTAIRNAVNDGFETLIDNGLIAGAQKSDDQLLQELVPLAYPGIVNKAGAIQGEELPGSGSALTGWKAANGGGCLWFAEQEGQKLLAVYTQLGGVSFYLPSADVLDASAYPELAEEIRGLSEAALGEADLSVPRTLSRLLPEGAEPVPAEIPGLSSCVVGAWTAETENGMLYAFAAKPYGYGNAAMDVYYVLDENGAISGLRIKQLFIEEEYFPNAPQVDKSAYQEGFLGLTAESYDGEPALIAGATLSTDAMDTATKAVFEAFWLLTADRG